MFVLSDSPFFRSLGFFAWFRSDSIKKMPLLPFGKDILMSRASLSFVTERDLQRMLLNETRWEILKVLDNISWMASDRIAFMKNDTTEKTKYKWTAASFHDFFKILASAGTREQFTTQQHDWTFPSPLFINFFQASRPLTNSSLARLLRSPLYSQNTGQININRRGRLGAS